MCQCVVSVLTGPGLMELGSSINVSYCAVLQDTGLKILNNVRHERCVVTKILVF
jgi:hypothetical protein